MNAVVSLCHFCEVHGPRVVFTCQPCRDDDELAAPTAESPDSGNGDAPSSFGAAPNKRFYGSYVQLLRPQLEATQAAADDSANCAACAAVGGWRPAFLTNDHAARVSFVSSRYPYNADVLALVRQSCLRSLSCEVSPGGGSTFFGDEQHGWTLSHAFTLMDAHARGFQRNFSLVLVSLDKLLLLAAYDLLSQCLASVADQLRDSARRTFERDEAAVSPSGLRLSTAGRAAMLPSGFLRQRVRSGSSVRALTSLSGDEQIFHRIHRYFVWILRAQPQSAVEVLLEGSPSQDVLVQFEEAAELAAELNNSAAEQPAETTAADDDAVEPSQRPLFYAQTSDASGTHDDALLQQPEMMQPYVDLQALARCLQRGELRLVLRGVVRGDQLVVRTEHAAVGARVLDALAALQPRGCARIVYRSDTYQERFLCNLLGLTAEAAVPDGDACREDRVLIDVSGGETAAGDWADLGQWRFSVAADAQGETCPTLVGRIEQLLREDGLAPAVLLAVLRTVRDEWLNKSKVLFQFKTEQPGAREADVQALMRVLGCNAADQRVVLFWQAGLSKHCKSRIRHCSARRSNLSMARRNAPIL